jgi:hypothetical protein
VREGTTYAEDIVAKAYRQVESQLQVGVDDYGPIPGCGNSPLPYVVSSAGWEPYGPVQVRRHHNYLSRWQ